jgi:hypothetical protein
MSAYLLRPCPDQHWGGPCEAARLVIGGPVTAALGWEGVFFIN